MVGVGHEGSPRRRGPVQPTPCVVDEERPLAPRADEAVERALVRWTERAQLRDVPGNDAECDGDQEEKDREQPLHYDAACRGGSSIERSDWNTSIAVRAIPTVSR